MRKLEYTVRFATPAFVGNAMGAGQWRTPPFKAQLRQWWRMVHAAGKAYRVDVNELRQAEGRLFGAAGGDDGRTAKTRRSRVRLRLDSWNTGTLNEWKGLEPGKVRAPAGHHVGPHAYLGFGPLMGGKETELKNIQHAVDAGESAGMALALPDEDEQSIREALWLMHRFGTMGGRSRNGWGSYMLEPGEDSGLLAPSVFSRPWEDALDLDWPHALGTDSGGLLMWQTSEHEDWQRAMRALAQVKLELRAQFPFSGDKTVPTPQDRHWLSYPVVQPHVIAWRNDNLRLPNSLRFKVCPAPGNSRKVIARVFHVPCLPPDGFHPDRERIRAVWQRVHQHLDRRGDLIRVNAGEL